MRHKSLSLDDYSFLFDSSLSNNSYKIRQLATTAFAVVSIGLAFSPSSAIAQDSIPAQSKSQLSRTGIELLATREAQRTVNEQKRIEGQGKYVTVTAQLNESGNTLILNFSIEYLPSDAYSSSEFEDLQTEVYNNCMVLLRDRSSVKGIEFLFGGKTLDDLFPEERLRDEQLRGRNRQSRGDRPLGMAGPIVVGAGHGIYYHYGFEDWRPQRDKVNGITEDFITPGYASELSTWLSSRSAATVMLARSTDTSNYKPSGEPRWKMGAKYYLKETYPDNPEIWDSQPGSTKNLRDRDEDIRSRPLFANHINASTAIHVHTNAGGSTATGATALYHTGRNADEKLANNILCYMAELIHAKDGYEEYVVAKTAEARSNLGENKLAEMKSVIVEAGFHTNPKDAAALKDPVFRTAAMKGVEKGYRLVNESTPCELFKIDKIRNVTGFFNVPIPIDVYYKGYPQFPVELTLEDVSCPPDWPCNGGGTISYDDKDPSPLTYTFTCITTDPEEPPATFRFRTILKDDDDVEPKGVEHNLTCISSAHAESVQTPFGQPKSPFNATK